MYKILLAALFVCSSLVVESPAQVISGSIAGIVTDAQGAAVPNAKILLRDEVQGGSRTLTTSPQGTFTFTPVNPSTYRVTIEASGFKKYERRNITVYADDHIELPDVKLEIGTVSETITVEGDQVQLQTESVQKEVVLTGQQAVDLPLVDRGFLGLLQVIPGYAGGDRYSANINGNRNDNMSIKLDGMSNMDSGVNMCCSTWVNPDTIAEFKVATNTQSAAIGHAGGASVMVVTKGGTKQLHGSAYLFLRNESLNANSWMNNYNNRPKSTYRYNTDGFTVGGPVFIPGKFNVNRDKLFFFASEEWQNTKSGGTLNIKTVPTALQRTGDYTGAKDNNGNPLIVKDPQNNGLAFPNNIIPANRFSPDGLALLKVMPLPNYCCDNTYNYTSAVPYNQPELIGTYKFDYNISDRWRSWLRYTRDHFTQDNPYGVSSSFPNLGTNETKRAAMGLAVSITTIISPTVTNEFSVGVSRNLIPQTQINLSYTRSKLGLTYTPLFPNAEVGDVGPSVSFGGGFISNSPSIGNSYGLPNFAYNTNINVTDNVAKVFSKHTFKAGFSFERDRKDQSNGNPVGTISFNQDNNNPLDSGYAFSNALLGNYGTFSQLDQQRVGKYRFTNFEMYAEDTWKATRKLTVTYGLRVSFVPPIYDAKGQLGNFLPNLYNPAQAVRLYTRAVNPATGKVAAYDPVSNTYLAPVFYDAIIPGSGNPLNGFVNGGANGVPQGLIDSRGPQWGPRLGLAYQVDKKTVVRVGGGIYYDRVQGNVVYGDLSIPPTTRQGTVYYGNLAQLQNAGQTYFPPSPGNNGAGLSPDGHLPTVYNWNMTVSRELPFKTVADISYVGNINRHLVELVNINTPAWGAAWQPQNQDLTQNNGVPKFDGTTTLNTNFYRPYLGLDRWNLLEFGGTANYNALQFSATHRLTGGLTFTAAYAFSKALGTADSIYNAGAIPGQVRSSNYGRLAYDRTQSLVLSYTYSIPKIVRGGNIAVNNFVTKTLLNNWQLSGFTTLRVGAPAQISYGVNGVSLANVITGNPDYGPRPVLTSNPNTGGGDLLQWFNTASFTQAAKGSHANDSGLGYLTGPGQNNFDLTLFKNIPFLKDSKKYVQFRAEAFNAFNKTQWSGINTGATFASLTSNQIVNLPIDVTKGVGPNGGRFGFGAANAVRTVPTSAANRVVQLALKVYF